MTSDGALVKPGSVEDLLASLRTLSAQKQDLDDQITTLVVYARDFVHPPVSWSVLASHTGLSASGVVFRVNKARETGVARQLRARES